MLLPSVLLFFLFLGLSAFFSSSETAFIASNPYTLESLEKKGSRKAKLVRKIISRTGDLLAAIVVGNTLVNAAAASLATSVFVTLIPNKSQAIPAATLVTTLLLVFFGELNPKTYAAFNPIKISFLFAYPVKFIMILFSPLVKILSFLSGMIFPASKKRAGGLAHNVSEEEVRILMSSGIRGLSALRKKMISGVMDIGTRPVKEIMVPRPQVKSIDIDASFSQLASIIRGAAYSRYPVFKTRVDNVEGIIHTKDIIPYLIDHKDFNIRTIIRKPFFVPESASLEKVLVQIQENAVHMAVIVDEFGAMEGIVTLEDILEEIVGEIQDEYDSKSDDEWLSRVDENVFIIKGSAPIKDINQRLPLGLPEKPDYTTLAGFFLYEFGRIPGERESFEYKGALFFVEKMNKRHISLVRISLNHESKEKAG